MEEEFKNIIGLVDDEGNEQNFEMIDRIEIDGEEYVALIPEYDEANELLEADGNLVILKVEIDEELGEETFVTIDNDAEFDKVADVFEQRFADGDDYELEQ